MAYEKNPDELGALWERESAKGKYFTGEILGQKVVIFANKKASDKAPDWRVLKSKPREDAPVREPEPVAEITDDSIPF